MTISELRDKDPLERNDRLRSDFVRGLVQRPNPPTWATTVHLDSPPKRIVHFWDDLDRLPEDVNECMKSWRNLEQAGFELGLFDESSAREFIRTHLGVRYEKAFDKCYHPSMKSDYFRYSYIFVKGGMYVDADDVYHGPTIDPLFTDGRLKLQPFCYDIRTDRMIPPTVFVSPGADEWGWIFYFNTTPLIAGRNHPIVERALLNATASLEQENLDQLPEVQAATGPGNLTRSVFEIVSDTPRPEDLFVVVHDWEKTSTSKWPLSYRSDRRNWRLSNRQKYRGPRDGESL
jgi:hypothetical protein